MDMHGNIHRIIPNLDQNPNLEMIPKPRIIKTHSPYNKRFKKVIYLLRDGRDSVLSYYKFTKKEFGYTGEFSEFLTSDACKCYNVRWEEHVESWLSKYHSSEMLLIKYEDLLKDFMRQFSKIIRFCGWETTKEDLLKIKIETDLMNMKKKEAQGMFLAHVDSGNTNNWIAGYSNEELKLFLRSARTTLRKYGYFNEKI